MFSKKYVSARVANNARFPVFAITHIHTTASNDRSSNLNELISSSVCEALGPGTVFDWGECPTRVTQLEKLVKTGASPPVGIVAVTDHVNPRSHRLADELLRVAAREPRIAASAEVQCVEQDLDGTYRPAPEVLVYGGGERVSGPYGPYYGLSQETLDHLFQSCRAPGLETVQTTRVLRYCEDRGIACCLAHPLDENELSLAGLFHLISRARFVETLNGGFPETSTAILEDFVRFQNRIVAGEGPSPEERLRYPKASALADWIAAGNPSILHPFGGSDAHCGHFDRVVVSFQSKRPTPSAGDLFSTMVEAPVSSLLSDNTLVPLGKPGTGWSVLNDVVRLVTWNLWRNRRHFAGSVSRNWRMSRKTWQVVDQELTRRWRRRRVLVEQARADYGFGLSNRSLAAPVAVGRLKTPSFGCTK